MGEKETIWRMDVLVVDASKTGRFEQAVKRAGGPQGSDDGSSLRGGYELIYHPHTNTESVALLRTSNEWEKRGDVEIRLIVVTASIERALEMIE